MGFFRGARAHRAPESMGVAWDQVTKRVTKDTESGDIVEEIHPRRDRLPRAHGLRNLEHVTDIEVAIEYDHDIEDRTLWRQLIQGRRPWQDGSDGDDDLKVLPRR